MKIAVIGTTPVNGEQGGAENFYQGLTNALIDAGVEAELICPVCNETNFETIKEAYLTFYDLDVSGYDGVISTKAPAYMVRHPNHIVYLQHTIRVFYDMFDKEFPDRNGELLHQRNFIQHLDSVALKPPRIRQLFVIGNEVKKRLLFYNMLDSIVLYQGLLKEHFKEGSFKHIFLPGRLHRWKRVDLIIKAMKYVKSPVQFLIVGKGEDEALLKRSARNDPRIKFLGRVSQEELIDLYANSLCIPYVPIHEDFGLVTIEAFRSGKPVITCNDSGEPTCLVKHGENGYVCKPDPREIAKNIDFLFQNQDLAYQMGNFGKISVQHISWNTTVETLLRAFS